MNLTEIVYNFYKLSMLWFIIIVNQSVGQAPALRFEPVLVHLYPSSFQFNWDEKMYDGALMSTLARRQMISSTEQLQCSVSKGSFVTKEMNLKKNIFLPESQFSSKVQKHINIF